MCLYIKKDAVVAVAEEDIEVYKILRYMAEDDQYLSPFRHYEYPMGVNPPVVHTSELRSTFEGIGYFTDNYREVYYTDKQEILDLGVTSVNGKDIFCTAIDLGLHTFANLADAKLYVQSNFVWAVRVVRCIIPKGSEYYKGLWAARGAYSSYASSQLIALEVIED